MHVKIVIHKSEQGGYWAEVPAIPGCASEAQSVEEVICQVRAEIEKSLSTAPVELCAHGEEVVELVM
jgi:predicted RNase H-like HicB family nuclease